MSMCARNYCSDIAIGYVFIQHVVSLYNALQLASSTNNLITRNLSVHVFTSI